MEHWKSRYWFDSFVMELVTVLFWRVFATIFLISYFKGGTGLVLSRGLHTSKVYFVIPDSPGGMAPTAGYRDEPDRDHNQRKEIEQSLNPILQEQSNVQESNHDMIVDPMQGYQLEIGQFNPTEVDGGIVTFPNSQNENLEEKEQDEAIVSKKREEKDLKEKEIFDEGFFLQVIPLAKPSTNRNVERS